MSFLKGFVVAGIVPLAVMLLIGVYIQPLQGDLTRVGRVAERSWGWNRDQRVIEQIPNEPTPASRVIVIGDSFSMGYPWQSAAQRRTGLTFATYHWNAIGPPACLRAAIAALRQAHPAAEFVMIQSVERHFVPRFADWTDPTAACARSIKPSKRVAELVPARRSTGLAALSGLPDPLYALRAVAAERKSYTGTEPTGGAYITPLTRDDLFSNRRSGWLLYYGEDAEKRNWTDEQILAAVGNIRTLSEEVRAQGLKPLFLIIPDKSTVYAPFMRENAIARPRADIWDELRKAGVPSLPLAEVFAREATQRVDFYLPNDTHLGNEARVLLGEEVAAFVASSGGSAPRDDEWAASTTTRR